MDYTLGFIGAGNMAEAIGRAALDHGLVPPAKLIVADPRAERRALFESMGAAATDDSARVVASAEQVVLAVKPQVFSVIAPLLASIDPAKQVVWSIMAGQSSGRIASAIGAGARVIRVMSNTPLLAECGMTAVSLGGAATEGDAELAMKTFASAGEAIRVDESLMDAVTAVSGSGPAYVFYLAEAMTEAAKALGLTDAHAVLLSQQTFLGAAHLMVQSEHDPQTLRKMVTTPGGTTEAAIRHMQKFQVHEHIVEGIRRAAERSHELGE